MVSKFSNYSFTRFFNLGSSVCPSGRCLMRIEETLYLNGIPELAESIIDGGKESLDECSKYVEDEEW